MKKNLLVLILGFCFSIFTVVSSANSLLDKMFNPAPAVSGIKQCSIGSATFCNCALGNAEDACKTLKKPPYPNCGASIVTSFIKRSSPMVDCEAEGFSPGTPAYNNCIAAVKYFVGHC